MEKPLQEAYDHKRARDNMKMEDLDDDGLKPTSADPQNHSKQENALPNLTNLGAKPQFNQGTFPTSKSNPYN
jgi:hypothetical protein